MRLKSKYLITQVHLRIIASTMRHASVFINQCDKFVIRCKISCKYTLNFNEECIKLSETSQTQIIKSKRTFNHLLKINFTVI